MRGYFVNVTGPWLNSDPSGEISLSYMDTHDGFLESSAGFSYISSSTPKMLFAFAVIVIYNVSKYFAIKASHHNWLKPWRDAFKQ